jgi:hypothetical protein
VKVTDILTKKGPRVVTVQASETIGALSALLREKRIGAAVVSKDGQSVSVPSHDDPPFREHDDSPFQLMAPPRTGVATQPVEGVSGIVG